MAYACFDHVAYLPFGALAVNCPFTEIAVKTGRPFYHGILKTESLPLNCLGRRDESTFRHQQSFSVFSVWLPYPLIRLLLCNSTAMNNTREIAVRWKVHRLLWTIMATLTAMGAIMARLVNFPIFHVHVALPFMCALYYTHNLDERFLMPLCEPVFFQASSDDDGVNKWRSSWSFFFYFAPLSLAWAELGKERKVAKSHAKFEQNTKRSVLRPICTCVSCNTIDRALRRAEWK